MVIEQWMWESARVVVPGLLVILGWMYVSYDNNKRETRKEKRQFLDRTILFLEDIAEDVVSYYITADQVEAQKLSSKIDPALLRIEGALSHLKLKDSSGKVVNAITLRDKITNSGSWRSAQKVALAPDCATIYQINVAFAELIGSLESAYTSTYQK